MVKVEARLTGCEDCRYIFSADGKYILGGMMVGDTADYVRLLALVKKKVSSPIALSFPLSLPLPFLYLFLSRMRNRR